MRRLVDEVPAGCGGGDLDGVRLDLALRPGKQLVEAVHLSSVLPQGAVYQAFCIRSPVMLSPWWDSTSTTGMSTWAKAYARASARSGEERPRARISFLVSTAICPFD